MEKEKLSLPIPKGDSAYNTASRYCKTIVAALASGMESREREADLELVGTLIEIHEAFVTAMDEEYQKAIDKLQINAEK